MTKITTTQDEKSMAKDTTHFEGPACTKWNTTEKS